MAEQFEPVSALLAEFATRLNEMEEKQRLIKDRILLIGENLVSTKEEYEKEIIEFKKQINQINSDIKGIKQTSRRIVDELENFARKTEFDILQKQAKMFQPLEFARVKDVQEIVKQEITKLNK